MTELKYISISFSLTLLLSLAAGSYNMDQKWYVGNQFGYEGGFCVPGLCIRGAGGSRFHYGGRGIRYNGGGIRDKVGYRETMYCKPLTCWAGSCDAVHLHIDKGLDETLVNKKTTKHPSVVAYIRENFKYNNYDFEKFKEAPMAPQSN